ncbi:MAG TPA: HD domain-containing phosphohydrolase, partial [Steroidobacteraceae bacterium]|nr:HD domain-containing phosphohydrolase [Steroidobacteraceae bacterium]
LSAERVLLQETLIGCIKALTDVLAITSPIAFGRASRVKRMAMDLADALGHRGFWQLEAAAMLSQLGYISLPVELVEKLYNGEPMTTEEKALAAGAPAVADSLLSNIARMEPVLQILAAINAAQDGKSQSLLGARILSLVLDYDSLVAQGQTSDSALGQLKISGRKYDIVLMEKFTALIGAGRGDQEIRHLPLKQVVPGMTMMDDLKNEFGILLVPRGFEVSDSFVARMRNYSPKQLNAEVRVMVKLIQPKQIEAG